MPTTCVIPGCSVRYTGDSTVSYHYFPKVSDPTRQQWLSFVRDIRQDGYSPGLNARLCSVHFEKSAFISLTAKTRRLKPGAVPTISGHQSSPPELDQDVLTIPQKRPRLELAVQVDASDTMQGVQISQPSPVPSSSQPGLCSLAALE